MAPLDEDIQAGDTGKLTWASTVSKKLNATIDPADYGADPTGAADSRTAFFDANAAGGISTSAKALAPRAGTYLINSNLTITSAYHPPRNCILKPASGVTITFTNSSIAAGYYRIFDLSLGGSISFGNSVTYQPMWCCPEWFGARGNANVNSGDTAAWLGLIASISNPNTPGVIVECPAGKNYRVTEKLIVSAPTTHLQMLFNGSIISAQSSQWTGDTGAGSGLLQIGAEGASTTLNYVRLDKMNLQVNSTPSKFLEATLRIHSAGFIHLTGPYNVGGVGEKCVYLGDENPIEVNLGDDYVISGGVYGVFHDGDLSGTSPANVLRYGKGKIQNQDKWGIWQRRGSPTDFEGRIDFSRCGTGGDADSGGAYFETVSGISGFHAYFELMGTGAANNPAKLVHFNDCRRVSIKSTQFNASNAGVNSAAYGEYLQNCLGVSHTACTWSNAMVEDLVIDGGEDITFDASCSTVLAESHHFRTTPRHKVTNGPVRFYMEPADHRRLTANGSRELTNYIPVPSDFDHVSWADYNGGVTVTSEGTAPDGRSTIKALTLPHNSSLKGLQIDTPTITGSDVGQNLRLRFFAYGDATVTRTKQYRELRVWLLRSDLADTEPNRVLYNVVSLAPGVMFVDIPVNTLTHYTGTALAAPGSDINYTLRLTNSSLLDGVKAHVWGIQLAPEGTPYNIDPNATSALIAKDVSYTLTNVTEDRTLDADSTSDAELADVLGTLIEDLKMRGVL